MVTSNVESTGLSRRRMLGLTLGGSAALLTGCGSSGGGDRELVFWHSYTQQERSDFIGKLARKFERQNPGVTVKVEVVPFPAMSRKWSSAHAGNSLPDVAVVVPEVAVDMHSAQALNPMDDVLEKLGGPEAFGTSFLDKMAKYKGEYILLPHYVHNRLLVYRKDRLEKAGVDVKPFEDDQVTWDDAMRAAKATTNPPGHYGWIFRLSKSDYGGGYALWILTRSNGGHFFDGSGKVTFDSPEVREAVEFMAEVAGTTGSRSSANYQISDGPQLVNSGKTSLIEESAAVLGQALKTAPDVAENLGVTYMPRKKEVGNLVGVVSLAMPKGKNPEDAKKFVEFLYAEENYVPFLHTIPIFMFPALKKADGPAFYDEPSIEKYRHAVDITLEGAAAGTNPGFDFGPNPYAGPVFQSHAVEDMMQKILLEKVSVDAAVKEAAKKMQQVVDDIKSRQ